MVTWNGVQIAMFVMAEASFGLLMGIGAQAVFQAIKAAGDTISKQMGMGLDAVTDPFTEEESSSLATFSDMIGTLIFFVIGGHLAMLDALHESFVQWPLGAFLSPEYMHRVTLNAVSQSFVLMLGIAAPMLVLSFLVSLVLAVMARLVPEMNVLVIGFPVRVGIGLMGMVLFVPMLVQGARDVTQHMVEFLYSVAGGGA